MKPHKFTLLSDDNAAGHPAGTVCYEFFGHDYGCCREDTQGTGREYITLTLNADGSGPFFTCPCDSLEPRPLRNYMVPSKQEKSA